MSILIVEPPEPLKIKTDFVSDTVMIEGILYSGSLFRAMGSASIGSRFEIADRPGDGALYLKTLPKAEEVS